MSDRDDYTRAGRMADEEESEYRMALRIEELTAERDALAARLAAVETLATSGREDGWVWKRDLRAVLRGDSSEAPA